MAIDPKVESVIGLHRFGLGPKRDSLARVGSDVRGALLADLDRRDGAHLSNGDLPSSGEAVRDAADFRRQTPDEPPCRSRGQSPEERC